MAGCDAKGETNGESGPSRKPCELRHWLLEISQEQQRVVETQLERHHRKLLRSLEGRFTLLEARLRIHEAGVHSPAGVRDVYCFSRCKSAPGDEPAADDGKAAVKAAADGGEGADDQGDNGEPSAVTIDSDGEQWLQTEKDRICQLKHLVDPGRRDHDEFDSAGASALDLSPNNTNDRLPSADTQRGETGVVQLKSTPRTLLAGVVPRPQCLSKRFTGLPFKGKSFLASLKEGSSNDDSGLCFYRWRHRTWCRIHSYFDVVMGILVTLNVALIFAQLQDAGGFADMALTGTSSSLEQLQETSEFRHVLYYCEHVFSAAYLLEIVARVFFCGRDYFTILNMTDLFIVLFTCADFYFVWQLKGSSGSLRLLQILRVGKSLRVIRTMSMFRHLRVLLSTIASSLISLAWSMTILVLCQLTSSLLICSLLHPFIMDSSQDHAARVWVNRHYGSAAKSFYTLFEVTFSGGWPSRARPLIEAVSPGYAVFFFVYITGVNFAMIRIISAMFLKETLQTAASDADMVIQEREQEMRCFSRRLRDLFMEADIDHDSSMSFKEFDKLVDYPKVRAWFSSMGVDVRDSRATFGLLDKNDDGIIDYDEFVDGILKLKGQARSQDIARSLLASEKLLGLCWETKQTCAVIATNLGMQLPLSGALRRSSA